MALIERNTAYSLNDIVNTKYGTKLKCTTAGTTSTDPLILDGTSPITDGTVVWEVQEEGTGQGLVDYEANKSYNVGDIVIHENIIYKCAIAHTSTAAFDESKWICISGGEISNGLETVPLWEGSFSFSNATNGAAPTSSTPMIELSDSVQNYEYLYIIGVCGSEASSTVLPVSKMVNSNYMRLDIFASTSYYTTTSISCYDNTHLFLYYSYNGGWPEGYITSVQGIRKAPTIVSSGMKYETLWEGEAGSLSGTFSTVLVPLSESIKKYKKIGIELFSDFGDVYGEYYREFDVNSFIDFINGISITENFIFNTGFGSSADFMEILNSSTDTQFAILGSKTICKKIIGISEGVVVPTGVQAAIVTLWEGTQQFSNSANIQLNDNINNYDMLEFTVSDDSNYMMNQIFNIDSILDANYFTISYMLNNSSAWARQGISISSSTNMQLMDYGLANNFVPEITKIVGIKYIQPDSYSTEEKLIGTWIDGKPLYRKVFTGLSITLQWNDKYFAYRADISLPLSNVDTLVSANGYGDNFSMPVTIDINRTTNLFGIRGVDTWTINSLAVEYTKN